MKAAGKKRLPSPRMGGRLRILDAFGNLIKPTEPERKSSVTVMKQTSETKMGPNDSPKRTTKLRILDSTGKEINEPKEAPMVTSTRDEATSPSKHSEDEEDVTALIEEIKIKHLERNRALELLKENISWLKDAFIKNDDRYAEFYSFIALKSKFFPLIARKSPGILNRNFLHYGNSRSGQGITRSSF